VEHDAGHVWVGKIAIYWRHQERHTANNSDTRLERKDSEVSPLTVKPAPANARGTIAPWEQQETTSPATQLSNYRSDLSVLQSSGNIPSTTQQSPSTISPFASGNGEGPPMATSIFAGSFYNDSSENLGQISPGFSPPDGMRFPTDGDDRRPSVASGTTVSSTGSKSSFSGKYKKKLQGFFGEEYPGADGSASRQNSETSSIQGAPLPAFAPGGGSRERDNSVNDAMLRSTPPSPTNVSRPRTPRPSSEVTPWVYQDAQVRGWSRLL